jgi:hypothetical protein
MGPDWRRGRAGGGGGRGHEQLEQSTVFARRVLPELWCVHDGAEGMRASVRRQYHPANGYEDDVVGYAKRQKQ